MSNGQAERYVDTFKGTLKKMENESNLDDNIQSFLFSYRTTPISNGSTSISPSELLFGRKIRTTFDLLKPNTPEPLFRNVQMENQFNKKHGAKERIFAIGDKVYTKNFKNNSWRWEEAVIISKVGDVNYLVRTPDRSIQAHTNQLKLRF